MSTTSGLGGSNSYTTSGLSASSLLSSHPNTSRKYSSSGSEEENLHSLATYQHHNHQLQLQQPHHRARGFETDSYSSYVFERRSAYGGNNTPELSRSPYNSRVPQMGVSAGHRRTMSNYSGYSQVQPHIHIVEPPITSKNPFLNSPVHNRTYENVPFSPNRHLYSFIPEQGRSPGGESKLRSSLKKKAAVTPSMLERDLSFSSSIHSCTPGTTTDGKSFSSS